MNNLEIVEHKIKPEKKAAGAMPPRTLFYDNGVLYMRIAEPDDEHTYLLSDNRTVSVLNLNTGLVTRVGRSMYYYLPTKVSTLTFTTIGH